MVISGIGVQQIRPRTGTGWKSANPTPDQNDDAEHGEMTAPKAENAPAAPGTGRNVDKKV